MKNFKEYLKENAGFTDSLNSILILDTSGSIIWWIIKNIKEIKNYLYDIFDVVLLKYDNIPVSFRNINIDELKLEIMKPTYGGMCELQKGVQFIKKSEEDFKNQNILIFTDGMEPIDISILKNNVYVLLTDPEGIANLGKNTIKTGDKKNYKIITLDDFYKPRDIDIQTYNARKDAKKFGL